MRSLGRNLFYPSKYLGLVLRQYNKPQKVSTRSDSKEKIGGILNLAVNKPSAFEASKSNRQVNQQIDALEPQIIKKKSGSEIILQTPDVKKADADIDVRRGSAVTDVQSISSPKKKPVEFLCVFEDGDAEKVCWLNEVDQMDSADWIGHLLGAIKEDGGVPQCLKCGSSPALAVFMNCTHGGLCPNCAKIQAISNNLCYFCGKVIHS